MSAPDDEVSRRLAALRDLSADDIENKLKGLDPPHTSPWDEQESWVGPSLDRVNADVDSRPPAYRRRSSIDRVEIKVQLPPGRVHSRDEEKELLDRMERSLNEGDSRGDTVPELPGETWLGPPPEQFEVPKDIADSAVPEESATQSELPK